VYSHVVTADEERDSETHIFYVQRVGVVVALGSAPSFNEQQNPGVKITPGVSVRRCGKSTATTTPASSRARKIGLSYASCLFYSFLPWVGHKPVIRSILSRLGLTPVLNPDTGGLFSGLPVFRPFLSSFPLLLLD